MRKILAIMLVLVVWGMATEELGLGLTPLKNTYSQPIINDTLIPAETVWTKIYSIAEIKGMSSYTSIFSEVDSIRDSVICSVTMREGYTQDGSYWSKTTSLGTLTRLAAGTTIDTFYTITLHPMPFIQFGIGNGGTGTDTIRIRRVDFYNHPR